VAVYRHIFFIHGQEKSSIDREINRSKNRKAILMLVALAIKLTLLTMTAALLAYVYVSYIAPHM
jgi:hypothetical protein